MKHWLLDKIFLNRNESIKVAFRFMANGNQVRVPSYDWDIIFTTGWMYRHKCNHRNGKLKSCHVKDDILFCDIPKRALANGDLSIIYKQRVPTDADTDTRRDILETKYILGFPYKNPEMIDVLGEKVLMLMDVDCTDINLILATEDRKAVITEDGLIIDLNKIFE